MNNKNVPTYQGISFQVPDYPESQRIDQSLEKIIKKTREVSERTGKTKEELYEEIDFDPEIFVDDYSRNFDYFEDLMSPEEASDYITSRLDELVDDPDPEESKIKKYGNKIKNFFSGKGFAFLAAGALLGATALSGCIGEAAAPSLPQQDGEVEIDEGPDEIITGGKEPGIIENVSEVSQIPDDGYLVFGAGDCAEIWVDGTLPGRDPDDPIYGRIKGNLSIENTRGLNPIPHFLWVKDLETGEIENKKELPREVNLPNFNGYGYINNWAVPHGPMGAKFALVGYSPGENSNLSGLEMEEFKLFYKQKQSD